MEEIARIPPAVEDQRFGPGVPDGRDRGRVVLAPAVSEVRDEPPGPVVREREAVEHVQQILRPVATEPARAQPEVHEIVVQQRRPDHPVARGELCASHQRGARDRGGFGRVSGTRQREDRVAQLRDRLGIDRLRVPAASGAAGEQRSCDRRGEPARQSETQDSESPKRLQRVSPKSRRIQVHGFNIESQLSSLFQDQ